VLPFTMQTLANGTGTVSTTCGVVGALVFWKHQKWRACIPKHRGKGTHRCTLLVFRKPPKTEVLTASCILEASETWELHDED